MYFLASRRAIAKVGTLRKPFEYLAAHTAKRIQQIMTQEHVDIKMILKQ